MNNQSFMCELILYSDESSTIRARGFTPEKEGKIRGEMLVTVAALLKKVKK